MPHPCTQNAQDTRRSPFQKVRAVSLVASLAGSLIVMSGLFSNLAAAKTPEKHEIKMHIWQDNALLSAPKIIAYEGETSELIISDPDTLKVELTIVPNPSASDQHSVPVAGSEEYLISSQVFLPQKASGATEQWVKVGEPQLLTRTKERASIALDIKELGLNHHNDRAIETLKLTFMVE